MDGQQRYLKHAYSGNARFEVVRPAPAPPARSVTAQPADPPVLTRRPSPTSWELDVRPLVSSRKWLQSYGLKKNKLTLRHILPGIGFKLCDEFDGSESLKKPISSRYGNGLYSKLTRPDGKTFNITGSRQHLEQVRKRLQQAVGLYRRRLEWLTTESRRVFGVVEERAVTVVLDVRNMSPQQFQQYCAVLNSVLTQQLAQLIKFNIIRAGEECESFGSECVPVSHDTVTAASQWLYSLDRLAPVSPTSTCEALLTALDDSSNEAVYLFTEGSSIETSKELIKEKMCSRQLKIPVHVVSYNCSSSQTITFLRGFAAAMGGRFHAYAVVMEMDAFESQSVDDVASSKANLVLKRKTYGGFAAGVGVREDVILVFEELEEARNILDQVSALSASTMPQPASNNISTVAGGKQSSDIECPDVDNEQSMSSLEWIERFGLKSQKLGLYDILSGVAFKHRDGVVDIMEKPLDLSQTDAVSKTKLVNAQYCEEFPVVRWRDGSVVHVQVTPDVHRDYEQRMQRTLHKIQQRIGWLREGSREVFGTVLEGQIYILLDCSASMQASLQFLKDKLFLLMQEQLRHKKKFNFISFNSKCSVWRDRLVEVTERNLQSAWGWVQGLTCWGSTNTYAAIARALEDPGAEAIYLLTDGRPDQPPKSILAQVQLKNQVPIHAISFNCNDKEANRFLYELARTTCGRYHYFSEEGVDADQPDSWESEDVQLLRQELKQGSDNLEQLANLRDQCSSTAWRRHTNKLKQNHSLSDVSNNKLSSNLGEMTGQSESKDDSTYDGKALCRPKSATRLRANHPRLGVSQSTSSLQASGASQSKARLRPKCASSPPAPNSRRSTSTLHKHPLVASHTRTSLLRTLNSCGRFSAHEWLLPETKELFAKQADRHKDLQRAQEKSEKLKRIREKQLQRDHNLSSRVWLKKNGLAAKKLTILDALSSTFVPHKAKFVPILDKHVVSQVFDQVIPLAHVSSRNKQVIQLISPNAVDLDRYQVEVHKAIDLYKQRLERILSQTLPEDQENGEDGCTYAERREQAMRVLEGGEGSAGVTKEDVELLEREMSRGHAFIQQARELTAAATKGLACRGEGQAGSEQEEEGESHKGILAQIADSDGPDKLPTEVMSEGKE